MYSIKRINMQNRNIYVNIHYTILVIGHNSLKFYVFQYINYEGGTFTSAFFSRHVSLKIT
jgi:hypothetical protein